MKFKDMGQFKPGDRVVFTGFSSMSIEYGERGTVMKTVEVSVEGCGKPLIALWINFDKENIHRHNLEGLCKTGHGFIVYNTNIKYEWEIDEGEEAKSIHEIF